MNFKVGDRVHHAAYGDGTVIGCAKCHGNVLIEFDKEMGGHNGYSPYNTTNVTGKPGHCWYANPILLTLMSPVRNPGWTLIVRPDKADPDKTIAILKVGGKETRHESVKRHHKDTYDMQAAIKAIVAKIAPPDEPPKPEPVKVEPIMIGNRELKVGSKFILKPHGEVDNHHGVSKSDWGDDFGKILVVSKVYASATPPYIDTENGRYLYCCDAIDRILEG